MKNKLYEEFSNEKFNKNNNYKAIISRIKEGENMEEKKVKKNKIVNIVAILMMGIIIGGVAPSIYARIQWNIKFKEYQNREYAEGTGIIKEAVESGYNEEIDMEYVTQNGISAKVDSLMITDDYFEAKISFKFADDIQVDSENFSFGYAIYDDENNIYGISSRGYEKLDVKYPLYIYEELGIKYNKKDIYTVQLSDSTMLGNVSATDRTIVSKITMNSTKGFPKSKKLYIRVFDLGYSMISLKEENGQLKDQQREDFSITTSEWIFAIDVPDKFYERQSIELKLKDEIPGVEIEKIIATETRLTIVTKIDGFGELVLSGKDMSSEEWEKLRNETVYITDEDGKIYYENSLGTLQEKEYFKLGYEINKNMLNKKLFFNIKIDGKQYTSELIKK